MQPECSPTINPQLRQTVSCPLIIHARSLD